MSGVLESVERDATRKIHICFVEVTVAAGALPRQVVIRVIIVIRVLRITNMI